MAMVTVGRRPATPWKIGVGVLLVLSSIVSSYSLLPTTDATASGLLGGLIR